MTSAGLKHKEDSPIVLVPLHTYSNLASLYLRLWPFFMVCFTVLFGVACANAAFFGRTYLASGDGLANVFIIFVLGMLAMLEACVFVFAVYALVLPARRERLGVASTLRSFDVHNTTAFHPADKRFVLQEIVRWWPNEAGDEAQSLSDFNAYVRTTVASRLNQLQCVRELQAMGIIVLVALSCFAGVVIGLFTAFGRLRPVGWPGFVAFWSSFVAPDECVLAASASGWCNTSTGIGHHTIVVAATCLEGRLVDVPSPSGCFGMWAMATSLLMFAMLCCLLCCTLGACYRSLEWAKKATGEMSMLPAWPGSAGGVTRVQQRV